MSKEVEGEEKDAFQEHQDQLDDFDGAFDEAIDDETPAKEEQGFDEEEESGRPDGDTESDPDDDEQPSDESDESTNGPDGDEPTDTGGEEEEPDWEERYKQAEAKMSSWDGRLRAAAKREQELLAELEALKSGKGDQDTGEADDGGSEEERENDQSEAEQALEEFYEDYPSLRKPLELLISRKVNEAITPIAKRTQEQERREHIAAEERARHSHIKAITEAHEDWEDIVNSGELNDWVERQPTFLAQAYKRVMSEGDTQEVIDLFTTFKDATGRHLSDEDTKDETTEPGQGDEERESIRKRRSRQAADGEAVRSRSGGAPRRASKEDFDAAFDEAVELDR